MVYLEARLIDGARASRSLPLRLARVRSLYRPPQMYRGVLLQHHTEIHMHQREAPGRMEVLDHTRGDPGIQQFR